ncbi:thioredoxin domain-containing protein [Nitratifractor sp.]
MPNRLIHEASPYLLQHAHNPVDWYPWGEEAFAKAAAEDKPIFLSVGYSSCHWCHVMERESFENPEIARILNERFVSIKVDREERPDIDRHFQEVFVTMNGRAGGWPLSVFMTPEKIPIYSATYIPPEPRYGMMGFKELLGLIADKYANDRTTLLTKGKEVLEYLRPKATIKATRITEDLERIAAKQIRQLYDRRYGGFGGAPKFPQISTLWLATDLAMLGGDGELRRIVGHTLEQMTRGGIYDIVDGGLCRYSTDEEWLVPHFEKMLYDNALMARMLLRYWETGGEERHRELAFEILDFLIDRMMEEDLFFSASDADTEGVEGGYFVYDYDEVIASFREGGIADPEEAARRLSITPEGNFEGRSIPRYRDRDGRDDPELTRAIEILKNIRSGREYPFIDRKIQSSWNAMAIGALFAAGVHERRYAEQAVRSLEALEGTMAAGMRLFHSTIRGREPSAHGFLEDYVWWGYALHEGYQSTLDERYLIRSVELFNEAIRRFYADGRWRLDDGEFRQFAEDADTGYPSAVGMAAWWAAELRTLVDPIYEKFLYRTLEVHSYDLMRQPIARLTLVEGALRFLRGDRILKGRPVILEPHRAERTHLGYPWVRLRTVPEEGISLCDNRSCFAHGESFGEVAKLLETE